MTTTTANSATSAKSGTRRANALPSGCMLDEYRIDSILGAGGFGVTYKAWDTHLETWVAVKEYFPVEWSFRDHDGLTVHPNTQGQTSVAEGQASDYLWGLERFLDEARVLARIQHPYVVRVKRYFRAHGTAYIVMDYEEGEPLNAILQDGETLGEDEVRGLLEDVLPALQAVHEQGYLHRDIKPGNLYVRTSDHRVILIDFGAAREAVGRHSKSVTSLVTPGYSPPEQYTTRNDRYGTWTDIYALGAVLYRCVVGRTPMEAAERLLDDRMEPVTRTRAGCYSTNLLRVIDQALAVRPEHRFQTVAEMQSALNGAWDEDNDETVVMAPLVKLRKPAQTPETAEVTEEPATPAAERNGGSSWLEVTRLPTAGHQMTGRRLSVLPIPPAETGPASPRQRRRLVILASGGLGLAALVATVVWLWPSALEEKSAPQSGFNRREPSVETAATPPIPAEIAASKVPPATPVSDSAAHGTAVETPPMVVPSSAPSAAFGVETGRASSSLVEPPATGAVTIPPPGVVGPSVPPPTETHTETAPAFPSETRDTAVQPTPTQESGVQGSPKPVGGSPAEPTAGRTSEPATGSIGAPPVPPVTSTAGKLQTGSPATGRTASSRDHKSAKDAKKGGARSARARIDRGRKPQPTVATPATPGQPRPASKLSTRGNPWEAPTDTGFNQK